MTQKGSAFEREICKELSRWWSKGMGLEERDDLFWRSSQSGGRATIRGRKGLSTIGHCGDICSTDPISATFTKVFTVELKRGYSNVTPMDLLDSKKENGIFKGWVRQVEEAKGRASSLYWLLVHRRDKRTPMVYTDYTNYRFTESNRMEFTLNPYSFFCLRFTDFLHWITPSEVEKEIELYYE